MTSGTPAGSIPEHPPKSTFIATRHEIVVTWPETVKKQVAICSLATLRTML